MRGRHARATKTRCVMTSKMLIEEGKKAGSGIADPLRDVGDEGGSPARWAVGTGELGCGVWRWGSAGRWVGPGPMREVLPNPRWDGCGMPRFREFSCSVRVVGVPCLPRGDDVHPLSQVLRGSCWCMWHE